MSEVMEFTRLPSLARGYVRAFLFGRRPLLGTGQTIPRIEASVRGVRAGPERLAAFRSICGFADTGTMPLTYPGVLGAPLHLAVLTSPKMPVRAMGVIHLRSEVVQHRPIRDDAELSIRAWVEGHRDVRSGIEFDIVTDVMDADGLAWESIMTLFARVPGRSDLERGPREGREEPATISKHVTWRIPADMGRRYAAVSGDYNPIHIFAPAARVLGGFSRAIVHGAWTLARCVAELGDSMPATPVKVECRFRRPVLLPSASHYLHGPEGDGIRFAVKSVATEKVQVTGLVRPVRQGG